RLPNFLTLLLASVVALSSVGCGSGPSDIALDEVKLDLEVVRLDEALYNATAAIQKDSTIGPEALFQQYFKEGEGFVTDWMFGGNDSIATDSLIGDALGAFGRDPYGQHLLDTVHEVLGGLDIKAALENPLKRYKYYFPNKSTPVVVAFVDGYPRTAQAGLDQIYISPTYLGIGMHYFMGPSFQYYPIDLPRYIRRRCTPEHIPALVVYKMADLIVPEPDLTKNPVLVDYVIREGIRMVFVDKLLGPQVSDSLKIFYEAGQLDWANLYEGRVYKDLVNDLYSADAVLQRRYVDDSPFTSQLNRGSAPRLGQFIGWRIVSEYMRKHPDVSLDALVQMKDYQKIFKDSGYRPPKEGE
ncbi:MAG TPA: hypothetical protein VHS96_11010, partial [Bacteroidia bacterium]|nr:hypothetical protein [Bacteroidia bacterium]